MYKFIVDGQWVLASDDRGVGTFSIFFFNNHFEIWLYSASSFSKLLPYLVNFDFSQISTPCLYIFLLTRLVIILTILEDDGNGNLNHVLVASSKISDNAAPPTFVEQTGSATSSEEGYNSSFHSENTDSDEELDQKYQSMTDSKSARSSQDTKVVDEQPKAVDQPLPSSTQPLVNHGEAEQASYGSVAANGENDTSVSKPNKKESWFWIARLIAAFLSGITSF